MLELIKQCNKVVAIGADVLFGRLDELLDSNIQILLAAPELKQRPVGNHITYHEQWISDHNNEITQYQFNLKHMHTLRPANQMLTLYPGLKVEQMRSVQPVSASDFIKKITLNAEEKNGLIVDMLGEEHSILKNLIDTQALKNFSVIVLVSYDTELFDDQRPHSQLLEILEQNGFDCLSTEEDKSSDLGKHLTLFRQNTLIPQLLQLKENLQLSQQENEELRTKIKDLQDNHKSVQNTVEQQIQKLEEQQVHSQQLKSELQAAQQKNEALESNTALLEKQAKNHESVMEENLLLKKQVTEQDNRIHQLDTENKEHLKQLAQIEILQKDLQDLKKQLAEKENYISSLENEKQELEYRQSQLDNEFTKVDAQLELLKEMLIK
ncbi:hypothetical protein [Gynuella sp.]|uniref:hypothetical protein n=1 Tax=Gynuella sp. TaxID=2969146 RepID=UPI003D0C69A9